MPDSEISNLRHPKGLYLLFFTEMWERFSYYGMRALLTIYCIAEISNGGLGWSASEAGQLYGFYTGMVYITTLIGGFLADRFLGQQRSVLIGGVLIALGHASLAMDSIYTFFLGLGLLIAGTGFFKPNISSLVGQLYPDGSPLKDAAYTIFYMGINIGSFMGILLCGYLGEKIGWHYGFGAAGVGMVLGLIIFNHWRKILGNVGLITKMIAEATNVTNKNQPFTKTEWDRIIVLLVLSFFSAIFWMSFEQAGSSMSIFALNYTNLYIAFLDFTIPSSWLQSFNALFIMLLAPVISYLWVYLAKKGKNISNPLKFSIALFAAGMGFFTLALGSISIPDGAVTASVSIWFLIICYLLQTIGEICLSPIGLSTVNKLSPPRIYSLMFGVWFLGMGCGNYLSGAIGGLIDDVSRESSVYSFFMITTFISIIAAIIMFLLAKPLKKMMHGIE